MKKGLKFFALLCAIMMTVASFVACEEKPAEETPAEDTPVVEEEPAE